MQRATTRAIYVAIALTAAWCCLFGNDNVAWNESLTGSHSFVTQAQAIIGRPLTPVSYAGVARRTVRRGVYY